MISFEYISQDQDAFRYIAKEIDSVEMLQSDFANIERQTILTAESFSLLAMKKCYSFRF